jgi:hypothetical protein
VPILGANKKTEENKTQDLEKIVRGTGREACTGWLGCPVQIAPTFVPGHILTKYKWTILTFVPGRATTRYKCEAFVPGELEQVPTNLCEETFVPVGGSNR